MKLFAACLPLALALSPTTASAQGSRTIRYADLDLRQAGDRATLNHRIQVAIRRACGGTADIGGIGNRQTRQCRNELLARATPERDRAIAKAMALK